MRRLSHLHINFLTPFRAAYNQRRLIELIRYVLEIVATWKFPLSLPRCAQYVFAEGILRQTRGFCYHENEVYKQA